MLVMQYGHRLPADYAMDRIRERAARRGPLWDAAPGLVFKAFALREHGRDGATDNAYASFYLWREAAAATAMLTDDRFAAVEAGFGRPEVALLAPIAWGAGPAEAIRSLRQEVWAVPPGTDLAALRRREAASVADALAGGAAACLSALDPGSWLLTRLTLAREPDTDAPGRAFTVLHLASPGWNALTIEA
ncbi:DUF4865 family protein [Methylobacterium sp. JK268]